MPLLSRIATIAAAIETTVGTGETLAAGDGAIRAYDVSMQPTIPVEDRESQGSFNSDPSIPGTRMGTMKFKTDVFVGASTAPDWATTLLPACGWVASALVYTPRSEALGTNVKSLTMGRYKGPGKVDQINGAVGKFQLVCPTGRAAYFDWEFQGVWQPEVDVTILAPTYPTTKGIRFASATCTYAAVAQKVENVTFDSGNEIIMREDPTTAGGYISGLITNRRPKITANPEAVLIATGEDRYADWLACTEAAFAVTLNGPSSSSLAIAAPKAQIINAQEGDRSRMLTDDLEWSCNKNAATKDQELSLTFVLES